MKENHTPFHNGLRNPYRNLKYKNSQDYVQKSQRKCAFMNSASGRTVHILYRATQSDTQTDRETFCFLYKLAPIVGQMGAEGY